MTPKLKEVVEKGAKTQELLAQAQAKYGITDEQIAKWKREHGELSLIVVGDEIGVVRKVNRRDLKESLPLIQSDGELGMLEQMLENVFLGGSDLILKDDDYFISALQVVKEMTTMKQAALLKL